MLISANDRFYDSNRQVPRWCLELANAAMIQTRDAFTPGLASITLDITAEFRGDDKRATMFLIWHLNCPESRSLHKFQVQRHDTFEQTKANVPTAQAFGRHLAGEIRHVIDAKLEVSRSRRGVGRLRRLLYG